MYSCLYTLTPPHRTIIVGGDYYCLFPRLLIDYVFTKVHGFGLSRSQTLPYTVVLSLSRTSSPPTSDYRVLPATLIDHDEVYLGIYSHIKLTVVIFLQYTLISKCPEACHR